MTVPPLPESPCLRVRLDYEESGSTLAGSRFYLSYGGAAPTAGNCITLAGDIAAAWATHLAPSIHQEYVLSEVDVIDIASHAGASGQWNGSNAGGDTSAAIPANCCVNIEYNIARRYRGGKPRMFMPPTGTDGMSTQDKWSSTYVNSVSTAVAAFFTQIEALSIGAMGALAHVNLSYYSGFTNVTNSSGRTRAVPKYRDTALVDSISGYAAKAVIGSQRRRRTATTY